MLRAPLAALLVLVASPCAFAAESSVRQVVASCEDGSVIFATKWEHVRCEGAIRMPPGFVPRVASEYDRALVVAEHSREREMEEQLAGFDARRRAASFAHTAVVMLPPREHAELAHFVERGSGPAAAALEYGRVAGPGERMTLAHSHPFDSQLRAAFAELGTPLAGPVLVFRFEPADAVASIPVPSFAQGGISFRPSSGDARQLGWIDAGDSAPAPDAPRLGYVALPVEFDLRRPLVIFWGNAVVATRAWRN